MINVLRFYISTMRRICAIPNMAVLLLLLLLLLLLPIPVAERSKAKVCGRSPAGIAGSNPAGGMDVCVVQEKTKGKARTIRKKK